MFARFKQRRTLEKCKRQWPDACVLTANGLRAGLSLQQAIELAASDAPVPIREELQQVVADIALGQGVEEAICRLEKRMPCEQVAVVSHAVSVLQTTGGNLVEVFDRVVAIVREQQRVAMKIRTLTLQGILSGAMVSLLPLFVLAIFGVCMPQWIRPLFTTSYGWIILCIAFSLQGAGIFWMKKIVRICV